jgi:hypothetical protein
LRFRLLRTVGEDDVNTAPGKIHEGVAAEAAASSHNDGDLGVR